MTRLSQHPFAPLAAVLVALAVVLGLTWLIRPGPTRAQAAPRPSHVPMAAATAVCPAPSSAKVAVVAPPGGGSSGRVEIRPVRGGKALGVVDRRGTLWTRDLPDGSDAVVVDATGPLAAGLEAEQTSLDASGGVQSFSAVRCATPATEAWFLGDGVALDRTTTLYLTNVDDTPAFVDVDVFGADGPVDPTGGRGIAVDPHSRKALPLRQLAAKVSPVAVHVRTSIGRVAAAVYTAADGGDGSHGADWLPQTVGPDREIVVPGLPGGDGSRRLLLFAPGEDDATAKVQLVTSKGTYAPHGDETVQVPAGSVVDVKLDGALTGSNAAVRVTSDVPLTAAAIAEEGDEVGYVSAVPVLNGGAVVADDRASGSVKTRLYLSAPAEDGEVRVETFASDGAEGASHVVKVPAGRTVPVDVAAPKGTRGSFAMVVTPTSHSGPVYGARMLIDSTGGGPLFTLLPLVTSPRSVVVPEVTRALSAAIPARDPH